MSKFPLTKMTLDMLCPGNIAQVDDIGLPSLLVYIPAFKNSDVLVDGDDSIHPAFIVNGVQVPGFYYSKYQNILYKDRAYSLPAENPVTVSFDEAYAYCENKGYGWHLGGVAEWAAIALWCRKNGFSPKGNNFSGKDITEEKNNAIPTTYAVDGTVDKVATGTGNLEWSHNGNMSGIWDLNGNVWEWQAGIRFVWGELQILANNDAADIDNPQNETSTCWKAINAIDGTLVTPECMLSDTPAKTTGNTVKIDFLNDVWTYSTSITNIIGGSKSCKFANVVCDSTIGNTTKILLQALALLPDNGDYGSADVCINNGVAEYCIYRGGSWDSGENSGIFSFSGGSRAVRSENIGFRASYIPNI